MAGDWIKMRGNLWDDPRVTRLCDLVDQSEAAVIGALYWLWSTADQHTEDGVMPGLTIRQIDRKTGVSGFGKALCEIGWLIENETGVRIIDFKTHNGASAKKRCSAAKRVANHRGGNYDVTPEALHNDNKSVSDALAREEKRREEKSNTEEKKEETSRKRSPPAVVDFVLPDWINKSHWDAWHSCAKRKKATNAQKQMAVDKLAAWKAKGVDYAAALENAAIGGWQGLFEPDSPTSVQPMRSRKGQPMSDADREAYSRAQAEEAKRLLFGDAQKADSNVIDMPITFLGMAQNETE